MVDRFKEIVTPDRALQGAMTIFLAIASAVIVTVLFFPGSDRQALGDHSSHRVLNRDAGGIEPVVFAGGTLRLLGLHCVNETTDILTAFSYRRVDVEGQAPVAGGEQKLEEDVLGNDCQQEIIETSLAAVMREGTWQLTGVVIGLADGTARVFQSEPFRVLPKPEVQQ